MRKEVRIIIKSIFYLIIIFLLGKTIDTFFYFENYGKDLSFKNDYRQPIIIEPAKPTIEPSPTPKVENKRLEHKNSSIEVSRSGFSQFKGDYIVTAYNLSSACTNKSHKDKSYGITASGYNLKNKSWTEAKAIAVDPNYIKLGAKVYIEFKNSKHKKYNGIYKAVDTGGAIKGKRIDFFLGANVSNSEAMEFGKTSASIYIVK